MLPWLLCGALALLSLLLLLRLAALHRSLDELRAFFAQNIAEESNGLIRLSSRDPHARRCASGLNAALRELREQRHAYLSGDRELKNAVVNVSHDLRTPLTAICGYVELLEREELSPDAARYVAVIGERAEAMRTLCEELFRLFSYGASEKAFRMLWEFGLMGDLLPDLAKFIAADGGAKSATWKYLAVLDRYERAMHDRGVDVANGLRAAVLYAAMAKSRPGRSREVMGTMLSSLKIPKATYFLSTLLLDSVKRLSQPPQRARRRFIHNRDCADALDFNRIVARAEGRSEETLDAWDALSRKSCNEQGDKNDRKERS